jgi:hypothetical protein
MRSRKVHLQGTHTHEKIDVIYINFPEDLFYFLLAAFFELLAFFAGAFLGAFFAAGAAVLLLGAVLEVVVEAAGADDVEAALPLDGLDFAALLLGFADPPAAFFFGDAAFFFGLLALPADFGLAAALDFGLAIRDRIIKKNTIQCVLFN